MRKPDSSLVFPYMAGPGIGRLATSLLYHGSLVVCVPGWPSNRPLLAFRRLADAAREAGHALSDPLNGVKHHFALAFRQGTQIAEELKPLGPEYIKRIVTVGSGTPETYSEWRQVHEACYDVALQALTEQRNMHAACHELIWRVYEHGLELGADPDNASTVDTCAVLGELERHAKELGGVGGVLAECYMNRFVLRRFAEGESAVSLTTDSAHACTILEHLDAGASCDDDLALEVKHETLSFFFFDNVTRPHVGLLRGRNAERLGRTLTDRGEELRLMREKCSSAAIEVLATQASPIIEEKLVDAKLQAMQAEVAAVLDLDASTTRNYLAALARDAKLWALPVGLVGAAAAGQGLMAASAALTGLCLLGAKAVGARQQKTAARSSSPWAFLYYARTDEDY